MTHIKMISKDARFEHKAFNPKVVKIGGQVWMAENLVIDDGGEGIYQHNGQTYYTWDAAMRVTKGLNGWHLPTKAEFGVLCTAAMDDRSGAGRMLKATDGWRDGYSTDRYGFSALPAGFRDKDGNYYDEGHYAYFWSSTEGSGGSAYVMYMPDYYDDAILNTSYPKNLAFSVRCLKD